MTHVPSKFSTASTGVLSRSLSLGSSRRRAGELRGELWSERCSITVNVGEPQNLDELEPQTHNLCKNTAMSEKAWKVADAWKSRAETSEADVRTLCHEIDTLRREIVRLQQDIAGREHERFLLLNEIDRMAINHHEAMKFNAHLLASSGSSAAESQRCTTAPPQDQTDV